MLTLNRPQPQREPGATDNVARSITLGGDSAPPRWARRCAWLAVLTTVPSGLWRMAMAVGIPVGASDEIRREHYGFPGWGTVYVFGLTFMLVGLALLTLGLVQRWGEVVPRWIPFVGGRRVPPLAAVVPAGGGVAALTLLWVSTMSNVETIWVRYGLEGGERVLMMACYAPLLLWGPLQAAVTVSYHRRHRAGGRRVHSKRGPRVTSGNSATGPASWSCRASVAPSSRSYRNESTISRTPACTSCRASWRSGPARCGPAVRRHEPSRSDSACSTCLWASSGISRRRQSGRCTSRLRTTSSTSPWER